MILYLVDSFAIESSVIGGRGIFWGKISENLFNFPFICGIKFQCLNTTIVAFSKI